MTARTTTRIRDTAVRHGGGFGFSRNHRRGNGQGETVLGGFSGTGGKRQTRARKAEDANKQLVSLRLDREVIDAYKSKGAGWQSLINETLKNAVRRS